MRRCLVVEDSRVIRKIACRILEEFEYTADEAEDGESALQSCRGTMPDLVLLDGDMPNFSGTEFIRGLRRERDGAKPLILYCVTELDQPQMTQLLGMGANHYILKPYDRDILRSRLDDLGLV